MLSRKWLPLVVVAALALALVSAQPADTPAGKSERDKALKTYNDGNYRDAYDLYRKFALDPNDDPIQVGNDLNMATNCLRNLNRTNEADDFREAVIKVHKDNWRLLQAAARNYVQIEPYGFMIAGEFERGQHRGGGKHVNCIERDRVRSLQLMVEAMKKARDDKNTADVAKFHLQFASHLMGYRGNAGAWRLQYLTGLATLPDYEEGYGYGFRGDAGDKGAPVNPDGTPVYHRIPKTWEDAKSDGERWRWLLLQAAELDAPLTNQARMTFAQFLQGQFGEQTMAYYAGFFRSRGDEDDTKKNESGTYELHTLAENETVCRLATGIKRFKLPDEFNYIKVFQTIANDPKTGHGEQALHSLAQVFANRRQYDKAADYWKRSIKEYGPGQNNYKQGQIDQILGNWGMFEPIMTQAAGQGASVDFRFRNGNKVSFEAHAINIKKLLDDVKAYIKSNPARLDWQKMNIADIGYQLVQRKQEQYLGEKVAAWDLDLTPRPMHFDKRITVATPLQKAGAYLLTAKITGGNTSKIIIWLDDTAIVKKNLDQKAWFFVADAASGAPVAKANVEFFGWRQRHIKDQLFVVDVINFAEFTDADGQLMPDPKNVPHDYRWLITATNEKGRFAYLGFTGVWYGNYHDPDYKATKAFAITDRPVYRPKQPVKFKFWVRHAKYDQENTSDFANQNFIVRINDPKGEKVFEKTYKADEYAGLDGEFLLEKDATLGQYAITLWTDPVHQIGWAGFRVEETACNVHKCSFPSCQARH